MIKIGMQIILLNFKIIDSNQMKRNPLTDQTK